MSSPSRLRVFARVSVTALLLPLPLAGAFTLVDDFESGTPGTTPPGWSVTDSGSVETSLVLAADPTGQANLVAALSGAGSSAGKTGNAWRSLDSIIPAQSSSATLFLRFYLEGGPLIDGHHHFFGVSKNSSPSEWGNYTGYFGAVGNPPDLLVRDQSQSTNVDVGNLTQGTWYSVWMVINNAADSYDLYINATGNPATQADRVADDFASRDTANSPIQTVLLRMGLLKDAGLRVFYDDLYVDYEGVNLANPLVEDFTLAAFMQVFYPGVTHPSVVGETADPDNDGKPNSWEYRFGTPPDDPANPGAPTMTIEDGVIVLTYQQLRNVAGINYTNEWTEGADGEDWNPLDVSPNVIGPSTFLPDHYDLVETYVQLP